MHTRLKVPAKNSPALLFLSRGKEEERKTTTISCFSPAEEELSRGIFGGNFQTRAHDGNKAAGLKVTTWINQIEVITLRVVKNIPLDELTFFGLVEPPGLGLSLSDEQPALGEF